MVATPANASARYGNLALTIEGVGGSAGQYRLAMGATPSWDSSGLYLPAVLLSWPDEVGASANGANGTPFNSAGTGPPGTKVAGRSASAHVSSAEALCGAWMTTCWPSSFRLGW